MNILPEAAATLAQDIDNVSIFVTWICVISFAIVMGGVIWFPIKYKRKSENDETPDIRGNHVAEAIWTIIPTILSIAIFAYGLIVYNDMRNIPEGEDVLEVRVTGRMWMWVFNYDNGASTINELVVPKDRDVRLVMKSDDVLHSFYVPAFRIKQDVLPTMYTKLWFNATKLGEHQIFCTEYCGKDHSAMLATAKVLTQEEFDAWLEEQVAPAGGSAVSAEQTGFDAYNKYGCAACHSVDGNAGVGPTFKGLWGKEEALVDGSKVTVDEAYILESLYEPTAKVVQGYGPIMPAFKGMISEEEGKGIAAYIKMISEGGTLEEANAKAAEKAPAGPAPTAESGKAAFAKYGCAACHSVDGTAGVGPTFKGLFGKDEKQTDGTTVKVDENYIAESIYEPTVKVVEGYSPIMPAFKGLISDAEVQGIIAYIKTLQ